MIANTVLINGTSDIISKAPMPRDASGGPDRANRHDPEQKSIDLLNRDSSMLSLKKISRRHFQKTGQSFASALKTDERHKFHTVSNCDFARHPLRLAC